MSITTKTIGQLWAIPVTFLLLLLGGSAQDVGVDICACQPSVYEITLNFKLICPNSTVAGTKGIVDDDCLITTRLPDTVNVTNYVPVTISEIQILELDQFQEVVGQAVYTDGPYFDGDSVLYTSIVRRTPDIINPVSLPRGIQASIVGNNAQNQPIVNTWGILYDNDCGIFPLLTVGQRIGWSVFTDLGNPPLEICPIAPPTAFPTVAPTTEGTAAPTIETTAAPTIAPTPKPTAAPTVPNVTAITEIGTNVTVQPQMNRTAQPEVPVPTKAPVKPTVSPTPRPSVEGKRPTVEGRPTWSGKTPTVVEGKRPTVEGKRPTVETVITKKNKPTNEQSYGGMSKITKSKKKKTVATKGETSGDTSTVSSKMDGGKRKSKMGKIEKENFSKSGSSKTKSSEETVTKSNVYTNKGSGNAGTSTVVKNGGASTNDSVDTTLESATDESTGTTTGESATDQSADTTTGESATDQSATDESADAETTTGTDSESETEPTRPHSPQNAVPEDAGNAGDEEENVGEHVGVGKDNKDNRGEQSDIEEKDVGKEDAGDDKDTGDEKNVGTDTAAGDAEGSVEPERGGSAASQHNETASGQSETNETASDQSSETNEGKDEVVNNDKNHKNRGKPPGGMARSLRPNRNNHYLS